MYGKIFESMYDGSLYGQWEAIVTFQQMIVIADKYGVVDMTPQALAGKTSIPLKIIEKGIEQLSQPDDLSRTPDEGGVRIILLDEHRPWGWEIVNYAKYCEKVKREDRRKQNRINQRNKREREAQADAQDASPAEPKRVDPKPKGKPKRFADFWKAYPNERRGNRDECEQIWASKNLDENADKVIADVNNRIKNDPQWQQEGGRFIPGALKYLESDRWEDSTGPTGKPREGLCWVQLKCDCNPHAWLAPDVLAKVSDEERAEYEYVKARNLENGHKEPDWNSPENRAFTKNLIEKVDRKPAEVSDGQLKSLRDAMGFKPQETS